MKVLLIHHILWSHYKAKVFTELYNLINIEDATFLVLQVAVTENARKKLGSPDPSIHKYPYKLLFNTSYEDTTALKRFILYVRYIQNYKPDIIILPGFFDKAVWVLMLYAKCHNIKLIQCVDSNYYDFRRVWIKERFKSFLLKISDLVYCYGQMQIDYLKTLSVPINKIHRRNQATDNARVLEIFNSTSIHFTENLPEKYFLYVGRLSKEKNLLTLINAFYKLETDWGLVIVGEGDQKKALIDYIERNQIKNIIFTGGKSWEEVVMYYKYAKVFVLPSTREPWGLVVNEAMLCGLPVLVSKHCGCSLDLVIEGENGYLFWPNDINKLMEILLRFTLMSEVELKQFGNRSREIIVEYNPETAALQMLEGAKKIFVN